MICDECYNITDNYNTINNISYCLNCINNYMLIPCPGEFCNNIISLNGFDGINDTENNTCSKCDTIFCNDCLIKSNNIKMCNECFDT